MATVTKSANANTTITTGWTNPTNAYTNAGVYATAVPGKNLNVTSDYGFPAFTTSDIPAGSTINSVKVELQFKVSVTSAIITQGIQINNNGSLQGTEQTNVAEPATDTLLSQTITTGVTQADLQTANFVKARCRAGNGSTNNTATVSMNDITMTVDYTPPAVLSTDLVEFIFSTPRTSSQTYFIA